jgi:hypothetical protein
MKSSHLAFKRIRWFYKMLKRTAVQKDSDIQIKPKKS